LRVDLAFADADALLSLADGHAKIVAPEVVEQYGDLKDSPVIGTGPWLWEETDSKTATRLSRNPDYFEEGLPFLDELEIRAIKPSDGAVSPDRERLAAFQAGMVDVALLPPVEWQELRASSTQAGSFISRQAGTGVVFSMNVQAPPLTQLSVRRAILRAIDPWNYVDTLWSGQGFVSLGIPVQGPDRLLGRNEMRNQYFADPGGAREMLASSGVDGPVDIEITVRTEEFGEVYLGLEERVADDLREVGFNPIIRRLNPGRFSETVLGDKDYQMALGVLPPTSTTNRFLMGLLHSGGRWNIAAHQDEVLDAMIERQASEFDPDLRGDQLRDIQRYVLDQAYLFSPVTGASRWVFSGEVQGFYPNTALSEYIYWSRVWLDR
jgi:ABC-type transport system substrate-binding protein